MFGRLATGIVAGLLAAAVLIGVVAVSYQAGRNDEQVVQVVDGETTTQVIEYVGHRHWGWGPGFGIFFFLIPVLLIVLLVGTIRRRRWNSWHYGPSGLDRWHQEAHAAVVATAGAPVPAPSVSPPPTPGPASPPPPGAS
jgi:hypothetical protein